MMQHSKMFGSVKMLFQKNTTTGHTCQYSLSNYQHDPPRIWDPVDVELHPFGVEA